MINAYFNYIYRYIIVKYKENSYNNNNISIIIKIILFNNFL